MFPNQVFVTQLPFISQTRMWRSPPAIPSSHLPALLFQLLLSLGQLRLKSSNDHLLAGPGPCVLLTQASPELLNLPLQLLPPTLSFG